MNDFSENDTLQELQKTLLHAEAMAHMTYGAVGEVMRGCNDRMQDQFMWALGDRISKAVELCERYEASFPKKAMVRGVKS